ncbi:unnamed protein product [Brassica oleracea]
MGLVLVQRSLEFFDEHLVDLPMEHLVGLEELREVDSRLVEGRVLQEEHQTVHHHSEVAEEQWSTNEQQNRGCHDSEVADLSFGMEESQVNPCQIEEMREIA